MQNLPSQNLLPSLEDKIGNGEGETAVEFTVERLHLRWRWRGNERFPKEEIVSGCGVLGTGKGTVATGKKTEERRTLQCRYSTGLADVSCGSDLALFLKASSNSDYFHLEF